MELPDHYHIGFPKAGSTTIQNVLKKDPRIQLIYKPGFFASDRWYSGVYPKQVDPSRYTVQSDETTMRQYFKGKKVGYRTVLNRIRSLKPDARFVLFLREQSSILLSEYKHHILFSSDPFDFGDFLNSPPGLFFREMIFYDRVVKDLMDLFPKENIHVFLVEEMKADPEGFLTRFYEKLFGMEPYSMEMGAENQGITTDMVKLKRKLNRRKLFKEERWAHHLDRFFLDQLYKGLGSFLSKRKADHELKKEYPYYEALLREYGKSNIRLEELLALPLVAYDYPMEKLEENETL
ncbi:MAG: hypothetical protein ABEH38_05945 [Flavobacteriales bacterium]